MKVGVSTINVRVDCALRPEQRTCKPSPPPSLNMVHGYTGVARLADFGAADGSPDRRSVFVCRPKYKTVPRV